MYEVFVNDRPLLLKSGPISEHENNGLSTALKKAFEDLENGRIERAEFEGDVEHLWSVFKALFNWVEAAGGLVFNPNNELLVIKRWGKWDLPKGKMEKGETPEESAIREVEEECGVNDLTLGSPVFPTYHTYRIKGKPVLKKTHWYAMTSSGQQSLIPQVEEDIEEVLWMNRDRWPEVHANTYANISRLLRAQT
ncbi:NUDIX domain-containing protein [Cryomorphaceae bacterium]|nr:NUDIX domain-containing protein [Cryomorphaceae bacterium]